MTHELVSTNGNAVGRGVVSRLEAGFRGRLIRPGDDDFDTARRVWNGMVDRRPGLIARCADASDVASAVGFAREHELLVAVRGGGHNVAGLAVSDGGLMIDLSPLKSVQVDPEHSLVRVEPGVVLGELDRATQRFSMAVPAGTVSSTGVAGLTLGGGLGWLSGKFGLTCTNLLRAEFVGADGQTLVASADENPDLLWGLRGGGGNFGVVTAFEFRAHPLGSIHGGMVVYPLAKAREVMRFHREFMAAAPDELTLGIVLATVPGFGPAVGVAGCYCGAVEQAETVLRPLRTFMEPAQNLFGPTNYLQVQTMLDAGTAPGFQNYWKSTFIRALDDATIEAIVGQFVGVTSELSLVLLVPFNGQLRRTGPDECAFSHRGAAGHIGIYARWSDPADSARHIKWAREFWNVLRPFMGDGAYVNELMVEYGDRSLRDVYGPNYDRLTTLKNKYDPENFFRLNHNIKPTQPAIRSEGPG